MTTSLQLRRYDENRRELRRAIERADAEWERGARERDASGGITTDIQRIRLDYAFAMSHLLECARLVRNDRSPHFDAEREILLSYTSLVKRVHINYPLKSLELRHLLKAAEGILGAARIRLFNSALDRAKSATEAAS